MDFILVKIDRFQELVKLHIAYKSEIGECCPGQRELESLKEAVEQEKINFYGCVCEGRLIACCSICIVYSTYNYNAAGVFEDFYILPEYRNRGIAGKLVKFALTNSHVHSLSVGCADCDIEMYKSLGFTITLGNMLAFDC